MGPEFFGADVLYANRMLRGAKGNPGQAGISHRAKRFAGDDRRDRETLAIDEQCQMIFNLHAGARYTQPDVVLVVDWSGKGILAEVAAAGQTSQNAVLPLPTDVDPALAIGIVRQRVGVACLDRPPVVDE